MRLIARSIVVVALAGLLAPVAALDTDRAIARTADAIAVGRTIYQEARLPTGAYVRAVRANGTVVNGREAACVNCHRRSGLGSVEGITVIPSITSQRLYESVAGRGSYDDVTLLRAIRDGIDAAGRPLGALMPRYELTEAAGAALLRYLREDLSRSHSVGVTGEVVHFATVIAPGVPASARSAMLEVLNAYFEDRNVPPLIAPRRRSVMAPEELNWKTGYRWQLHVWELDGSADTWTAQLHRYYDEQPVFAVIGGLSAGAWTPVHAFCETTGTPCLFPTVDLPVVAERDFYSLYFSKGVLLEADVLARYLLDREGETGSLVQLFRTEGPGSVPARRLAEQLRQRGWSVEDRTIEEPAKRTTPGTGGSGTVVLWLSENDVRSVSSAADAATWPGRVYISATLLGEDCDRLPEALLSRADLIYPYELTHRRGAAYATYRSWLARHRIVETSERVQAQAYFAATAASEAMSRMAGNASREELVERVENMAGRTLAGLLYPRLGLGQGQRFASKGAYLARCPSTADRPVAISEWIVP